MPDFNIKDSVYCIGSAGRLRAFYGIGIVTEYLPETEAFPELYRIEYTDQHGEAQTVLARPEHLAMAKPNPLQPRKNGKSAMPLSDSISAVPRTITQSPGPASIPAARKATIRAVVDLEITVYPETPLHRQDLLEALNMDDGIVQFTEVHSIELRGKKP